ncbi:HAD hydrolase-like protein [Rubrobacter tropicus]|nr:HAD hydrolase-like protein [Rubrobacter tropicus]
MVNPKRVWMVGDDADADVRGAEAAGIPAILVRGRHEGRSVAAGTFLASRR